ncbi:hypothetical protein K9S39_25780 [Streptomyces halobius]|uniref:Transposase n=1 Tax=Streptomyces halobius TaxID=2879846 RepID=A0ABY4MDJ2_9ACTN|nr:hypothetical protein K9S39_25780 [Streptomyces halobius]
MAERVQVREIDEDEGRRLRIIRRGTGVGGDLPAGPDGAAVRAGDGSGEDRRGDVHQRGPGPGCDPPLQCRRRGHPRTASLTSSRIEAQFTALRYVTLDGTDHASHKEQGSMIRRYIIWRNHHADDQRLRAVVDRANAA